MRFSSYTGGCICGVLFGHKNIQIEGNDKFSTFNVKRMKYDLGINFPD
jgi:hypothetical protein